jgi:NAD(P)-dependent dehydrogenase (short-subunit alcohol dehydrogenase family)
MDLQLKGKRALVTGSTGGIGEIIAKVLAREGARVLVHGRRDAEAKRVVSDIEKAGGSAIAVLGDLATDEGAKQAIDGVEKSGGVDILVNNAGTWDGRAWFEVEPAEWGALYNANVVASVRMIKALAPAMKKAGWGRIIQMASGVATAPPPGREPHYAATKAALVNLTVGLGKEMLGSGVTVNAVSPGIVLTPVIEGAFRGLAQQRGWGNDWAVIERHVMTEVFHMPNGRMGRPDDIANLIAYVASPLGGYIHGTNLHVDGGYVGSVT